MTDTPPPMLKEALVATEHGQVLGRTPANWLTPVRVRIWVEGVASKLVLVFADGQTGEIPLPPQLVGPGAVQDFGVLGVRREGAG